MSEKIIAKYLDEEVEISVENLLSVEFQIEGKKFRIKIVQDKWKQREEMGLLEISVDAQLIVYPRASNLVWIRTEGW